MVRRVDDLSTAIDQRLALELKRWRSKLGELHQRNVSLERELGAARERTAARELEAAGEIGRRKCEVAAAEAGRRIAEAAREQAEEDCAAAESAAAAERRKRIGQASALVDAEKRNSALLLRCKLAQQMAGELGAAVENEQAERRATEAAAQEAYRREDRLRSNAALAGGRAAAAEASRAAVEDAMANLAREMTANTDACGRLSDELREASFLQEETQERLATAAGDRSARLRTRMGERRQASQC